MTENDIKYRQGRSKKQADNKSCLWVESHNGACVPFSGLFHWTKQVW